MNFNLHQAQSHDILRSWQSQRNDIDHYKDFVLPMFIGNDDDAVEPIESMPKVNRYGINRAIEYLEPLVYSFGLRAVLLFPVITKTDKKSNINMSQKSDQGQFSDSSTSAANSYSPPSSSPLSTTSSSSSSSDDDMDRPDAPGATTVGSQNPFLNQNEEEEDHLLAGDERPSHEAAPAVADIKAADKQKSEIGFVTDQLIPPTPVAAGKQLVSKLTSPFTKVTKSHDIKLIKGMALKEDYNPVLRLLPKLSAKFPKLLIICDVCLCAFTSTGHCCLFDDHAQAARPASSQPANGFHSNQFPISNKTTCQYLAMLAVEYALRGCNVVAPSDMMDGRILTIRERLNENRLFHVSIMSYSAKFASAFYGPFRQATENAPEFGDRRAYQLPPGSRALALKAVERDIKQGADFVMVKPGGPYLDIVRDIRELHPEVPVAIYQVSGEYSMLNVAAEAKVIDLKRAVTEMLTAYRRAGATIIITYFTPDILRGQLASADA